MIKYDESKPFDYDHIEIIFKTYEIFHAVSKAVRDQKNEQCKILRDQYPNVFEYLYKLDSIKEAQYYFDPVKEES